MMPFFLSPTRPNRFAFTLCLPFFATLSCLHAVYRESPQVPGEPSGVYIPSDQRHKGLSRFDRLPFTDRKLGDPDRYRALNPNFVKHENGHYYLLLDAQPNTPYCDDDLKEKGVLTDTANVPADLGEWKEAKSAGSDKTVRYVYVRDKGYVLRSRLTPSEEISTGKWFRFPIKSGTPPTLCDGMGIVRGTLAANTVRLNYGQQKQIHGETYYYAFATSIILETTKQKSGASGWIKASALQAGNDPAYGAEVIQKMQPPAAPGPFTPYELTGGDPMEKAGSDTVSGMPIYKWGYMDEASQFVSYKVLPGVALAGKASIASTDYLKRNDDVINLGFNACGVSNDTYRISTAQRPLLFYRSGDKDATATVDLFYPKDAHHEGKQIVGKMVWVYGYVDETTGKRWGWLPLGALKPKR